MSKNSIDTLTTELKKNNSTAILENSSFLESNWFWITTLLILSIFIFLFLKTRKRKNLDLSELNRKDKKEFKKQKIDMNDIMKDINLSKNLYKELSKKYHPDRYINNPKHDMAEKLFQEITANQKNYKKLVELKEQAENQLSN